jgi:hypothetical protein
VQRLHGSTLKNNQIKSKGRHHGKERTNPNRLHARQCGNSALEALEIAAAMFPNTRPQALIDKLVITGLCALHWKAPSLYGADRDRWKLPDNVGPG